MVRYWYSFTPLVFVFAVIPLALPWLGLIALMLFAVIALAVLGALAWGIVFVPYMLVRSVGRRLRSRHGIGHQAPQSMPAGAVVLLASSPSESERLT
jgi:hypothetical protein